MEKEHAVGVCIVTFRRPKQLVKLLKSIKKNTLYGHYKIYIIIDYENDLITIKTLNELKLVGELPIRKIEMFQTSVECVKTTNRCYSIGREPYFVWISDDMEVERGWLKEAMKCMMTFPNEKGLVTFRDGLQDGRNSPAGLISRRYIQKELGGIFYNEIYMHFGADTELFKRSQMRNKVKYCPKSIVWHNHWGGHGKHKSKKDEIYAYSDRWRKQDRRIFARRKKEGFK